MSGNVRKSDYVILPVAWYLAGNVRKCEVVLQLSPSTLVDYGGLLHYAYN